MGSAPRIYSDVVTVSRDVGIPATAAVIQASVIPKRFIARVVRIWGRVLIKVPLDLESQHPSPRYLTCH